MWNYDDVNSITIELSSLCNAACPWCPRYEDFSEVVNRQLEPQYITIDQFKEWFPPDFMSRIKLWAFTGDYGDAGTNPDLPDIIRHIYKHNPDAQLSMNTNGGMRTPDFWGLLGQLFSRKEHNNMIFSIDGLEDTNHIYRRNVRWNKVMKNVLAFLDAGGKATWECLVFRHNKHQIDAIQDLANYMGFSEVHFKMPKGFEKDNMKVKDKKGNHTYTIYPTSKDQISTGYPDLHGKKAEDLDYEEIRDDMESYYSNEQGEIKCFSQRDDLTELKITSWGTVYPCCHFGHIAKHPRENQQYYKAQLIDIFKDKDISLKSRTLKEILDDDPFNWIYNSWKKKSCLACWSNCGVSESKQPIMQQIFNKEGKLYGTT